MAGYINMQQPEYDDIQKSLKTIHENIIADEEKIRNLIIELTQIEGGFYINMISDKISRLMSEMKLGAIAQLESAFTNTEQAAEAFVNAVIQIDVVDA